MPCILVKWYVDTFLLFIYIPHSIVQFSILSNLTKVCILKVCSFFAYWGKKISVFSRMLVWTADSKKWSYFVWHICLIVVDVAFNLELHYIALTYRKLYCHIRRKHKHVRPHLKWRMEFININNIILFEFDRRMMSTFTH